MVVYKEVVNKIEGAHTQTSPCPKGIGLLAFRTDTLFTPAPENWDRRFYLSIYLSAHTHTHTHSLQGNNIDLSILLKGPYQLTFIICYQMLIDIFYENNNDGASSNCMDVVQNSPCRTFFICSLQSKHLDINHIFLIHLWFDLEPQRFHTFIFPLNSFIWVQIGYYHETWYLIKNDCSK